jgi:hypothetical protein
MKAIVALAAAVALSGCANYAPYGYDAPYYSSPYYGSPYYGGAPYVMPPYPYYYGYGYGFYDFPGLYPSYPWFGHRLHPRSRPGGLGPAPATTQQPGRDPRVGAGSGGGGSGGSARRGAAGNMGGGGSGGSLAGPAGNTGASSGGGGSGYVPNQPPDR